VTTVKNLIQITSDSKQLLLRQQNVEYKDIISAADLIFPSFCSSSMLFNDVFSLLVSDHPSPSTTSVHPIMVGSRIQLKDR